MEIVVVSSTTLYTMPICVCVLYNFSIYTDQEVYFRQTWTADGNYTLFESRAHKGYYLAMDYEGVFTLSNEFTEKIKIFSVEHTRLHDRLFAHLPNSLNRCYLAFDENGFQLHTACSLTATSVDIVKANLLLE